MSQVVSTKRVLALVRVKLWPPIFPQKSIATEIILTAKKVYLKPTLQCTYVNTAKRQHLYSCFHKSNNNNCYNLTGRARTVSPIKHTGLVPVRLGKQKVRPTYVWDRKHRAQRLRDRKTWDHLWYNEIIFTNIPLHLKIETTTIKDTNGKKKFKRMPSFLFVDKRKLFAMTLSFEDRIGSDRSAWLVLNQQGSEVSEDTWGTFRTLWLKKTTFLKGNFCILMVSWTVFYILISAWKKNHKICIWNWFFAMCSTDLTVVNANCFLGLTCGFLNKHFQEIKLFICHCSFHNISSIKKRPWDYRSWDF